VIGERNSIRSGYRWDVFASFVCNASAVRVATRKTKRGADRLAGRFAEVNRKFGCDGAYSKLRHDPLLDEVMNKKRGRRG